MSRRGFSLLDCVVAIIILFVALGVVGIVVLGHVRKQVWLNYDQTQVRGIQQAMVTWGGNGQDQYPLPSNVDLEDTIPGIDTKEQPHRKFEKDLPRWIFSILIYNGNIGPEMLVTLGEVNTQFRPNGTYEYTNPTAVKTELRAKAVLDPSFAAYPDEPGGDSPIKGRGGTAPTPSVSYAILPLIGPRKVAWASTFDGTQAVVANRGPWYSQDSKHNWSLNTTDRRGAKNIRATESNTLLIHGSRSTWEGNVARNDGSVNFETRPDPENIPLFPGWTGSEQHRSAHTRYDNLFANEDEESQSSVYSSTDDDITESTSSRRNNYLRCFGDRATRRFDDKTGQLIALGNFWYD